METKIIHRAERRCRRTLPAYDGPERSLAASQWSTASCIARTVYGLSVPGSKPALMASKSAPKSVLSHASAIWAARTVVRAKKESLLLLAAQRVERHDDGVGDRRVPPAGHNIKPGRGMGGAMRHPIPRNCFSPPRPLPPGWRRSQRGVSSDANKIGMDRFRIPITALGRENDTQLFEYLSPGVGNCGMKQLWQQSVVYSLLMYCGQCLCRKRRKA